MKFRIRCGRNTTAVEIENKPDATVTELKTIFLQSVVGLSLGIDIRLSLNGETALEDGSTLCDAGITSGDLLYVLLPPGTQADTLLRCQGSLDNNARCSSSMSSGAMSLDVSGDAGTSTSMQTHGSGDAIWSISEPCLSHNSTCREEAGRVAEEEQEEEMPAAETEINRYLKEPMLIRESTDSMLPQSVVRFFNEANVQSLHGALAVLMKVLMNELGFMEQDKGRLVANIHEWTSGQSLQMDFAYPTMDEASFTLLLLPMRGTLFVHGYARLPDAEAMNLKRPIMVSEFVRYIVSGDACETYRGNCLPKLSQVFKDVIAYPLLQYALEGSGLCIRPGLSTLVWELQVAIFKYLDAASLLRLSEVCQHLNGVCKDRAIWRSLFIREFGAKLTSKELKQDWKEMYKEKYLFRKKMKEASRVRNFLHPYFQPPPIVPIGGEYDLYPFFHDPNFFALPGQHPVPQSPFSFSAVPSVWEIDDHLLPPLHPAVRRGRFNCRGSGPLSRF